MGAVLVTVALEIHALSDRSRGEPRNGDVRRYVLGEIYDGYRVEQRMLVKANGFSSVTIHPRPASASPTGTVVLQVRDITRGGSGEVVKRTVTPLPSLAQTASFTIHFPPQPSFYREYALEITVEGGSDGQGVGFLASRGQGYRDAILLINGATRWGDLIFETTVEEAAPNFQVIARQLGRGGIPVPQGVLALLLLAKTVFIFLLIRASFQPRQPDLQAQPGRAL